ncbi:MAG: dephospho-CoA kinase [Desulfobacterales bacterium]|nr:dephospho-CoA kinase [Desulfobacterales bacterium]MCP4158710.1 dephospho-CoA kinase [Deltaproteobacteria bacterium]
MKKNKNGLLVGVTGGIATGKSTVSKLLKVKGAELIDFDILAREVVEKGKPALTQIADFFGNDVICDDGTLSRKKLSDIVFNDVNKRKKLESITHPAIFAAFNEKVKIIKNEKSDAIIQAEIPLLIELKLMHMFDKVIVVYVPENEQIKRLVNRDGISESEAVRILKSQLPIDEKKDVADFVFDNQGTYSEAELKVNVLWDYLVKANKGKG